MVPIGHRAALTIGAAALSLAGCGGSQPPIGAPRAYSAGYFAPPIGSVEAPTLPNHKTFSFHDKEQYFTVPAGVTSLTVVVRGAAGGLVGGGLGARVYARVPVVPEETLAIFVGGIGKKGGGGFNGGGQGGWVHGPYNAGGGGGGASDIREGGDALLTASLSRPAAADRARVTARAMASAAAAAVSTAKAVSTAGGATVLVPGMAVAAERRREAVPGAAVRSASGTEMETAVRPATAATAAGCPAATTTSVAGVVAAGRILRRRWRAALEPDLVESKQHSGGGGGGGSSYVEPTATRAKMWQGWKMRPATALSSLVGNE